MTLHELKAVVDQAIKEGHGKLDVLVSRDPEGNAFHDLDELTLEYCYQDEPVHPDDVGTEYDPKDIENKMVIWPS